MSVKRAKLVSAEGESESGVSGGSHVIGRDLPSIAIQRISSEQGMFNSLIRFISWTEVAIVW